jgi:hypothetical protein
MPVLHVNDANAGQKSKTADNQPGQSTKSSTIMDLEYQKNQRHPSI